MPGVRGAYVQRGQMSGYGEREARESLRPGGTEGVISAIIGLRIRHGPCVVASRVAVQSTLTERSRAVLI